MQHPETRPETVPINKPNQQSSKTMQAAKTQQLDQVKLILPRKDGKVQIGSFPRPI